MTDEHLDTVIEWSRRLSSGKWLLILEGKKLLRIRLQEGRDGGRLGESGKVIAGDLLERFAREINWGEMVEIYWRYLLEIDYRNLLEIY